MAANRLLLCLSMSLALAACGERADPASPASAGPAAPATAPTADVPDRSLAAGAMAPSGGPIDVRPLAGQAEAGVRAMLGEPAACTDVPQGRSCRYARGRTEVVFIDGMADWIRVGDLGGAPFDAASLQKLGIGPADPASKDATSIRWQNVDGFREVEMVAGEGGGIDHVQLKAMTP